MHKRRSTQFWLRWLVIVCIVPAWAATAFFIVMSYERGRDIKKVDTIATARALMQTVDGELARTTSALQILATAPSLAAGNLADFYAQSREGLRAMAAVNVVLIDPSGQQILNTLRPLGAKLPPDSLYSRLPLVFTEDKPVITDLFSGPVTGRPMTAVAVPVIHDGRTVYELGAGIPPEAIAEVTSHGSRTSCI